MLALRQASTANENKSLKPCLFTLMSPQHVGLTRDMAENVHLEKFR